MTLEYRSAALRKYLDEIDKMLEKGRDKLIAVGECGLDYDRLEYADKES